MKTNKSPKANRVSGSVKRVVVPRGFVTVPTAEQLAPTERERALLKQLWDWQEASRHSTIILGVPHARHNSDYPTGKR